MLYLHLDSLSPSSSSTVSQTVLSLKLRFINGQRAAVPNHERLSFKKFSGSETPQPPTKRATLLALPRHSLRLCANFNTNTLSPLYEHRLPVDQTAERMHQLLDHVYGNSMRAREITAHPLLYTFSSSLNKIN